VGRSMCACPVSSLPAPPCASTLPRRRAPGRVPIGSKWPGRTASATREARPRGRPGLCCRVVQRWLNQFIAGVALLS
jgi:hypothetical protein